MEEGESNKAKSSSGDNKKLASSLDEMIDRKWGERANAMTTVRKKLRSGWRNDEAVLEQYFNSCENNWKLYTGPRTPKQVLKLQALYKQATCGDAPENTPLSMEEDKFVAWRRLRGMDQVMAKRRYITFLAEINPLLIDVMPDEKPPEGFPLDRHGHLICAKCNTTVGCARPLLDSHNTDLRQQLFEREELHEPDALKVWVRNALATQRCVWGLHQPITKAQSREFVHWFDRPENKGFHAYDSSAVMHMVRELVVYHYEVTYDMMQNKSEYSIEDYNDQATRAIKLREVYVQLSGEIFEFEVPCNRNNHQCNEQRRADGGKNHTHVVEIDPPSRMDVASFKEAIELRTQCQMLGLSPVTGVITDIEKRCQIYRDRLAEHFKALEKASEAKKRNLARTDVHRDQKQQVVELSSNMIVRQLSDACHSNRPDRVMVLVKRGADPNEESLRGLTPLLCFILCEATVELVEDLISKRADINFVNKYGITPLMLACKLRNTKVVHMLMRLGASVLQHGGNSGNMNTAMHWAAIHGAEDEAKIIVDHVRDSAGDSLRVSRCIDAQNLDGETPLMLAARYRNGVMCRFLVSAGAATNVRNKVGRTAAFIARQCGWSELADWLDTKLGSGVARIETFSDLNYDKKIRYGTIKVRDLLIDFAKNYLVVVQGKSGKHCLLPPSIIQQSVFEDGERALQDQSKLVNRHQLIINQRNEWNREELRDGQNPAVQVFNKIQGMLPEILDFVAKGLAAPGLDTSTNPMSLTPLMCAAMIGDIRSMRLLVREGAHVDGKNRYGTTPLMIAAQLNNIETCIELLTLGADLAVTDNFGFTPLAYANSLPLPKAMTRSGMDVIMDDDIDGVKPLCAADILKTASDSGIEGLREMVEINAQQSHPDTIDLNYKIIRLLEQFGLTKMYSESEVALQAYTSEWRLSNSANADVRKIAYKKDDDESEADAGAGTPTPPPDDSEPEEEDMYSLRCPMCTLMLPCSHFFKGSVLRRYFQRLKEQKEAEAKGLTGGALEEGKAARKKSPLRAKGLKARDKTAEILEETGINDRGTDRSFTLAQKYRARELQLEREREAIEAARAEAERKAKLKAYALARGEWVEWREFYNTRGELEIRHQETDEVWVRYFDKNRNPYYYNAATNESRWIAPNKMPKPPPASPSVLTLENNAPPNDTEIVQNSKSSSPNQSKSSSRQASPESKRNERGGRNQMSTSSSVGSERPSSAERHSSANSVTLLNQSPSDATTSVTSGNRKPPSKLNVDVSADESKEGSTSPNNAATPKALQSPSSSLKMRSSNLPLVSSPRALTQPVIELSSAVSVTPVSLAEKISQDSSGTDEGKLKSILKIGDEVHAKRTKARRVFFSLPGEEPPVRPKALVSSKMTVNVAPVVDKSEPSNDSENKLPASSESLESRALSMLSSSSIDHDDVDSKETAESVSNLALISATDTNSALGESKSDKSDASSVVPLSGLVVDNVVSSQLAIHKPSVESPASRRSPVKKSDLVGENPVPIVGRRILSFTSDVKDWGGEWDALSASHHFTSSPLTHSLARIDISHDDAELEIGDREEAKEKIDMAKTVKSRKDAHFQPICLTGWLFVGLSVSKPGPPPIEFVQISLNMWATVIDHLRTMFMEVWLPCMRLEPAVNLARAATVAAPRCSVCHTGLVRVSSEENPQSLCLQCLMRKEIFEKVKPCLPRSYRARNPMQWPFDDRSDVARTHSPAKSMAREYMLPASINLKGLGGKGSALSGSAAATAKRANQSSSNDSALILASLSNLLDVSTSNSSISPTEGTTNSSSRRSRLVESVSDQGLSSSKSPGVSEETISSARSKAASAAKWDTAVDWFDRFDNLQSNDDDQFALGRGAGVKDLPLLPYLVAKGHIEDLERTVRACFHQADEADSLQILPRLLGMQAEAYKLLGMWPLALALMLDRADILATLTGYENVATIEAVCHVATVLRKMNCGHLASMYVKSICRRLEQKYHSILSSSDSAHNWLELAKDIQIADSKRIKESKLLDKFWKDAIAAAMPSRETRRRAFQSLGLGGLYYVMSSTKGHCVAIRLAFESHCTTCDPVGLGKFATFASSCMQLRSCDDWEVFQHLLHEILHKQLAQSLITKSEVARLYLEVTPYEHQAALAKFLKVGTPIGVHVFDELLLVSLKALAPEYSAFFRSAGSALFRQHLPNLIVDAESASVTMIQACWRVKKAYKRLLMLRRYHHDHVKKQKDLEFS